MTGRRILLLGMAQAAGAAAYISLVVLVITVADKVVQPSSKAHPGNTFLGMMSFLLLFVISAAVTGAAVLGYPAVLAFRQRIREAVLLVAATVGWLVVLLVPVLSLFALQVLRAR